MIIFLFGYLCLSENGLADLMKSSHEFNKTWLIMAVLCHALNMVIDIFLVYRFTLTNEPNFKFKDAIKISMIGQFFSAVTPSATGGQPMQVFAMSIRGIDAGTATSSLTQKFLVYQAALTGYGIFAILVRLKYFLSLDRLVWGFTAAGFAAQTIVIAALILFSFNPKFTHKVIVFIFTLLSKAKILKEPEKKIITLENSLELFHKGNSELYKNKPLLFETLVITIVQLTAVFFIPYCVFRAFNMSGARVLDMICAQAFINMVSWVIPLPGASGGAEAASVVFLSPFFNESTIKSAVVITRLISYHLTILISAPFSRLPKDKKEEFISK